MLIPVISCGDACRKHTAPSLHEHLMRDLVDSPSARGLTHARGGRATGRFTGSRDGTPELIAETTYYESWNYTVLRRTREGWTEIYHGGGGGC